MLLADEGAGELAGAALQQGGAGGRVVVGAREGRGLGHQIEVEELDEFELDVSGSRSAAEQRGDGQEAVLGFEGACVARRVDQGDNEGKERGALDGGAINRLDEV